MSKILIIEDEECICGFVDDMLSLSGHTVDCAHTVDAGLLAYFANHYDLLITDWNLPDGSGEHIIQSILMQQSTCKVLISTGGDATAIVEVVEDSYNIKYDVLLKPFKLAELLDKVNKLLN